MADREHGDPCEICGTADALPRTEPGYDGIQQICPRCGEFKLSGTALAVIRRVPLSDRIKLSGYVHDLNDLNETPELTSNRIGSICATPLPSILERADRLLDYAIRSQYRLGARLTLDDPEILAATYSEDLNEVRFLAGFLDSEGLVKLLPQRAKLDVEPKGYIRHDEQRAHPSASAQGFVAMWFDQTLQSAYDEGFERGIREAGYVPRRVDDVEHVGKIDDEIIAQIKQSRFVVADFTGQRGGVYFEAGFALGLNLPVIWSCKKDEIRNLHFDIRQFNCISWEQPPELAEKLRIRIEAVIGIGPNRR